MAVLLRIASPLAAALPSNEAILQLWGGMFLVAAVVYMASRAVMRDDPLGHHLVALVGLSMALAVVGYDIRTTGGRQWGDVLGVMAFYVAAYGILNLVVEPAPPMRWRRHTLCLLRDGSLAFRRKVPPDAVPVLLPVDQWAAWDRARRRPRLVEPGSVYSKDATRRCRAQFGPVICPRTAPATQSYCRLHRRHTPDPAHASPASVRQ